MGDKYIVKKETDIFGNDQTVIKRGVSAYDVGSAVGLGAGLLVAAHKNSQMNAALSTIEAAQKYLEAGALENALGSANALIGMSDKEAQTVGHFFKASALVGLGQYDDAISEFTSTIEMARAVNHLDKLTVAFVGRGQCYYRKNDLSAAMRDFTNYIQLEPTEDAGYYWQGLALAKLGDLDQALVKLNQAVSINPGDSDNYCARANVYARQQEIDKALSDFSRAITLNPQNGLAYRRRAELYTGRNDDALAIADYSRAIELDPDNLENYKARAELYQRTGDSAKSALDVAKVGREAPIQQTYQQYLQAATAAFDSGITAVYTEADTLAKPNWLGSLVLICVVGAVGLFSMTICAASARGFGLPLFITVASFLGTVYIIWSIISSTLTDAPKKVKAATAYLQMRARNEEQFPGFEEFFTQFLQAKKESRLQDLPTRTRSFFESGGGAQAVAAYTPDI